MLKMLAVGVLMLVAGALYGQAMTGTYIINKAGGTGVSFTDIGAAFDALEANGVGGACVFEIYDDGGNYTSSDSYSLGRSAAGIGVQITGASTINTVTFRAASGEFPKVTGSAAKSAWSTIQTGCMVIQYCTGFTIEGVDFSGGTYYGIMIHRGGASPTFSWSNCTVRRCSFHGINGPAVFAWANGGGLTSVNYDGNVVYDCTLTNQSISGYPSGLLTICQVASPNTITNNTVIYSGGVSNTAGIALTLTSGSRDASLKNNVVVCTAATGYCLYSDTASKYVGANYNCLYALAGGIYVEVTTVVTPFTYAQWQTGGGGRDAAGINVNPQLVSTTTGSMNAHLSSGSPCIDVGEIGSTTNRDIDQESRPYGSRIDMGGDEYVPAGPMLTVAATAGTAQAVLATDTGGGNGRSIGTFTITNNALGVSTLNSVTLASSGSGNDSNAYSEVGIFEDTNSNSAYDPGTDQRYGASAVAFPSDNGNLNFAQVTTFAASTSRRFFVVVKLNGSTLPTVGQTFDTRVNAIAVGTGTTSAGTPSAIMSGLVVTAPTLTVSATAGTAQNVYASDTGTGGTGLNIGTFTITNGTLGPADLASITIAATGTGNDSNAYSEVGLFEDTNANSTYDPGTDTRYGAASTAFPSDNGSITFSGAKNFAVSATVRYFVIVKLNGSTPASPSQTFNSQVNAIAVTGGATTAGTPSTVMNGLVILAPSFTFTDNSSATQANAYLGGSDFVIQQFTIAYPNGPANTLTSITVQSAGNGNDQTDYASVALYRDANANATYNPGVDVQVATFTAFPSDNGSQAVTLTGTESQFTAGTTRQYFIVVAFNMNGTNNTTFATQLQAASGQSTGTTISGIPAPASGPTAGLLLLANNLIVTLNGPGTATTVNNNDQGPGGIGLVIFDVTLATVASTWTVSDLTFTGKGTANHQTAYNYLALFLDSNANGSFDAADTLATTAAGTGFGAGNTYTATLSNTTFPASTTRRYFLVGKLAGTAIAGQTLNAQLTGATTVPPSGGVVSTIPTGDSTALIIDTAVLTAVNAATAPAAAMREGGAAFGHTLGYFSFTASNNSATLNGITLTTAGSGDWTTDVASVELYLDDGNNTYDGAPTDTLLFTGAGATPTVTCTFGSAVNISNNQTRSIWVRVNFAAAAGASVPETFSASIAAAGDINVTGATALLGTPTPTTNAVSVILFFVTTFAPAFDLQTGGAAITITGSGFLSPLSVTIGGAVCPGTAVISGGGTQITGLTVPPGSGQNRPIVINNGALGAKTLTQTFDYAGGSIIGGAGGGGGGGGGGCEATQTNAAWLAALALLGVSGALALRRRVLSR